VRGGFAVFFVVAVWLSSDWLLPSCCLVSELLLPDLLVFASSFFFWFLPLMTWLF
jgi:hypothetical protein